MSSAMRVQPSQSTTSTWISDVNAVDLDLAAFRDVRVAWQRLVDAGSASPTSSAHSAHWAVALEGMLDVRRCLAREGRWSAGPASLMEVLEIERNEVANCKVLRWLLDPIARHGLGAGLIRALAEHIGFEIADTTTCTVETEVSREATRADLVISGIDGEVVVIEAKIDAGEQPTQAARLERHWPEAGAFVFLTNEGVRLPRTRTESHRWSAVSWRWLAHEVMRLSDLSNHDDPVITHAHASARTWADSIRRNLG